MKILHINTFDSGGAAKAVLRLQEGLICEGIDSKMLVLYRENTQKENVYNFLSHSSSLWQRLKTSILHRWDDYRKQSQLRHKSQIYEVFSFPNTVYDLNNHPLVKEADIIHLHWVAGFLDYSSFFRRINKPVVWTLHDMSPFNGGFHYEQDFIRNQADFAKMDAKFHQIKQDALAHLKEMQVINLSKWIYDKSKTSQSMKRFNHTHIVNSINLDIYKKTNKLAARKILNLPLDKPLVLFVADSIHNKRKGFEYLNKALQIIDNQEIGLAIVGKGPVGKYPFATYKLDFIDDDRLMAAAYSAADVCVVPSLEDNLPNTVMEAMACATPVVGFEVGGIAEMIRHNETGFLAKPQNIKDLADKLAYLLAEEELCLLFGKNARQIAEQTYSQTIQAQKHLEIYTEILHGNANTKTFNKDLTAVWHKSV